MNTYIFSISPDNRTWYRISVSACNDQDALALVQSAFPSYVITSLNYTSYVT